MISNYVTSLQPPEGLPISETLTDFPVPLQKLHCHLENPGLFPYPSITVMPMGPTGSCLWVWLYLLAEFQQFWPRYPCPIEQTEMLLLFATQISPNLELSWWNINMHAPFIPSTPLLWCPFYEEHFWWLEMHSAVSAFFLRQPLKSSLWV